MAPVPFLSGEEGDIPRGDAIRGLELIDNQEQLETEATDLHHDATLVINFNMYYRCIYHRYATSRVYYRGHDEGKMGCAVKKAYLSPKTIRGPTGPQVAILCIA